MKNIEQSLVENVGFSAKKAKTYLALLSLGEARAADIANKAGLKRTTVYNILPELMRDGFIKSTTQKGRKYFFVDETNELVDRAHERLNSIKNIMPELDALQSLTASDHSITHYEGLGGLREMYGTLLENTSPRDIVLTYISSDSFEKNVPSDLLDFYVKKRLTKKVRTRLITESNEYMSEWFQKVPTTLREIRHADKKYFSFAGELRIVGPKIFFITYEKDFYGVVVENKELSTMFRNMFNLIWDMLPESN